MLRGDEDRNGAGLGTATEREVGASFRWDGAVEEVACERGPKSPAEASHRMRWGQGK